jgi:hypothetical protein
MTKLRDIGTFRHRAFIGGDIFLWFFRCFYVLFITMNSTARRCSVVAQSFAVLQITSEIEKKYIEKK